MRVSPARVQRITVQPGSAHYASGLSVPATGLPSRTPEDWARAAFEG